MNELIKICCDNERPTVSSRQIAENFEKRHDNILRDIEAFKVDVLNFEEMFYETTEPDSYDRPQKVYHMTRDGFSLLAMGFTGSKALEWKLKYIAAFNAMEKTISSSKPMSTLEIMRNMLDKAIEHENRIDHLEAKMQVICEKPAIVDWCRWANDTINRIVESQGFNHQTYRSDLYKELEETAHCDIGKRQTQLVRRLREAGHTATECKAISKLHVINNDPKLRVIFEGIVKREVARCS